MPSAVAYVRVSTEEQSSEGVSLEAQDKTLRAYCTMRGLGLVEVICDAGVSGGKALASREGGQRLLQQVRRHQAVVAWKLDRLFRDCADCLTVVRKWDKASVALHLVDLGGQAVDTSTAMGRFFLTVMAGAAELERNQIRERTAAAMKHKAEKGEFIGGELPYGYQMAEDGVHLVGVSKEQQVVERVREMRAQGMTLREMGEELRRQAIYPRDARAWHPQQLKRLLDRKAA